MINELSTSHNPRILEIINKAAQVYKGVIPDDRWKEPYMSKEELKKEIEEGVKFMGYKENTTILGIMGIQQVKDTTLIRHAYITPKYQKKGIGKKNTKTANNPNKYSRSSSRNMGSCNMGNKVL